MSDSHGEIKAVPKSMEERVLALESQVTNLKSENQMLIERLDLTENNVSGFIQEMSEMLDSNELNSMNNQELGLENLLSDSTENGEENIAEGTGGSKQKNYQKKKDSKKSGANFKSGSQNQKYPINK